MSQTKQARRQEAQEYKQSLEKQFKEELGRLNSTKQEIEKYNTELKGLFVKVKAQRIISDDLDLQKITLNDEILKLNNEITRLKSLIQSDNEFISKKEKELLEKEEKLEQEAKSLSRTNQTVDNNLNIKANQLIKQENTLNLKEKRLDDREASLNGLDSKTQNDLANLSVQEKKIAKDIQKQASKQAETQSKIDELNSLNVSIQEDKEFIVNQTEINKQNREKLDVREAELKDNEINFALKEAELNKREGRVKNLIQVHSLGGKI